MTRIFIARRSTGLATLAAALLFAAAGWTIHATRAADTANGGKLSSGSVGADEFTVPEGTPAELLAFIDRIGQAQPPADARSREDIRAFMLKSRTAMLQAAEKILAARPNSKTRMAAIHAKVEALAILDEVSDDPKVTKQLHDYVDQLQQDKEPEVAKTGRQVALMLRVRALHEDPIANEADAPKVWSEAKAALIAGPDDPENVELAMMAAQAIEGIAEKRPDMVARADRELASILSKSKDPNIAGYAKEFEEGARRFDGMARRMALIGHPIEIKGTTIDGRPFDPATLKGKVVLIDYWATWCGPCRAELPNILDNYKKYHDRGFEVVGVSLDKERGVLEKFIAKEKLPWPILFSGNSEEEFWSAPMAIYYGVTSIPTIILTNQKGEVVSLDVRGPELGKKLAELLGK